MFLHWCPPPTCVFFFPITFGELFSLEPRCRCFPEECYSLFVALCWLVHRFWPRQKHLSYWMDCHWILHRHSWSPEDKAYRLCWPPDFSSSATMRFCLDLSQCLLATTWWIAMEFAAVVHGAQKINFKAFGDALTLQLVPPASHPVKYFNLGWKEMDWHNVLYRKSSWLWWPSSFSFRKCQPMRLKYWNWWSQQLLDGFQWIFVQTLMFPTGWTVITLKTLHWV